MSKGNSFKAIVFAVSAIAGCCSTSAFAGGVSAGSLIENTAVATFEDGGTTRSVDSNTVSILVDELLDTTVTSSDATAIAVQPGQAVLTFEVTNQGNGPEAFNLTANPAVAGNDFNTTITGIFADTNNNGIYEPGVDPELTGAATTPSLAADEALTIFVVVEVPTGVNDMEESDVELTAEAATGTGAPGTVYATQGDGGGDAVVGTSGASATATGSLLATIVNVELTKAVTLSDPFGGSATVPGSTATFTLTAAVLGTGTINDLVITDAIPTGTTYVDNSLTLDTAPLTDASDADAGEGSNASGISVDLGSVSGGASHVITFQVTVD